jgi:3-oxoacyl-[acyl-carrier protein] reductase
MNNILSGKQAIITGANQGLGLEIARLFVKSGADLMICARNEVLLKSAYEELIQLISKHQKLVFQVADISDASDVSNLFERTLCSLGGCQILVNNAGVYGPMGTIETLNWDEWVKAIEVNLFGSVLMTRAFIPHFKLQGYGKIIQLSGGGATSPLPRISAYAASKAAIVRFAETLAEEVRGSGIDVNSLAPGSLNTRLLEEVLQAGPEKVGNLFFERSKIQKDSGGSSILKAAELALFLASSASDGITSKLISAIWDEWEEWPKHLDELSQSDVYTLRRIAGRDRGFTWGDK